MKTLEFLVEEASAEEALKHILPKLLPLSTRYFVRNFGSKHKLLGLINDRFRAYASRIRSGEDLLIVVLVDRDADNCEDLKRRLELAARNTGLVTKTSVKRSERFRVLNRIVVEELESWYLGDPQALRRAFPSLPAINQNSNPFRNPDNGGTWEALHRYLKRNGIFRSSFPKIEAARRISPHLDLTLNRSSSFRCFVTGVSALVRQP